MAFQPHHYLSTCCLLFTSKTKKASQTFSELNFPLLDVELSSSSPTFYLSLSRSFHVAFSIFLSLSLSFSIFPCHFFHLSISLSLSPSFHVAFSIFPCRFLQFCISLFLNLFLDVFLYNLKSGYLRTDFILFSW